MPERIAKTNIRRCKIRDEIEPVLADHKSRVVFVVRTTGIIRLPARLLVEGCRALA